MATCPTGKRLHFCDFFRYGLKKPDLIANTLESSIQTNM